MQTDDRATQGQTQHTVPCVLPAEMHASWAVLLCTLFSLEQEADLHGQEFCFIAGSKSLHAVLKEGVANTMRIRLPKRRQHAK